jgi:putative heme-binding domain-containing protein
MVGLREIVLEAQAIAGDAGRSDEDRRRAILIAANGGAARVEQLVRESVRPTVPQSVQTAAVSAAAQANAAPAWQWLFGQWATHTTPTRQAVLDQATRCSSGLNALVDALEGGILSADELPATIRDVLAQANDESLRRRMHPILAAVMPADRAEVVARYAGAARRRGDASRGATLFKQHCMTCHAIQGTGQKMGPDLASVASRRTDLLLVDILDPSQQVSPDYINYIVVTKDGRVLNGVIASETSESVTLRREEGQQDTIRRIDIEELRGSGKSIMPDGLEQKLSVDQLADLLEFLHVPNTNELN